MILRKLESHEHGRTRKLWEAIFEEDTKKFLDYYYEVKTAENEIYVIEEDGQIVSMLHLNPYQMRIGKQVFQTHYIVAVATDENYRKRGYMASLLNHVMQVMKDRGEPFTFLMPAAETIYKPFGFEYIYEQQRGKVTGRYCENDNHTYAMATEKDCQEIADYANERLNRYEVVTWRDANYYKMLLKEQLSEDGGILLVREHDELVGVFCFAKGNQIEVREPLYNSESILQHAVYVLTGDEKEEVQCIGYGEEVKPMIMAKVLCPEKILNLKELKVFLNEVV